MIETPRVVRVAAQQAAVLHVAVPREEIAAVMGPGLARVMAAVASQGKVPAGPWFAHHLCMDPGAFDFEIGVPVEDPIVAAGGVVPGELPSGLVARTVYQGDFDGLYSAWQEFDAWVADKGYAPRPDLWEVYLTGPEAGPDPSTWRTELNRPLVD
jgi:effector-binding domain-containing protein